MATSIEQITISLPVAISIGAVLVACLGGYIWDKHIKELAAAKKLIGTAVQKTDLEEVKRNFEHKLQQGEERFLRIEENQREDARLIREEFRQESIEMRREINGMGKRLADQGEASELRIANQVNTMGQNFVAQMANMAAHQKTQNESIIRLVDEVSKKIPISKVVQ